MSKYMNIVERRRRGLGSSASRTYHLTLIGAKNDVITIKDSGGNTVGTCTFPSGATQGTIDVSGNPSELYTFTSSIAKDTTSGTSAYSKQMYLSDDALKVMPNGALYWYGNGTVVELIKSFNEYWPHGYGATLTQNTNSFNFTSPSSGSFVASVVQIGSQVDITPYDKIKLKVKESSITRITGSTNQIYANLRLTTNIGTYISDGSIVYQNYLQSSNNITSFNGILELDISDKTGNAISVIAVARTNEERITTNTIDALWLE